MRYNKRNWDNTGNDVTKNDFKRIEDGIEANDAEISNMKDESLEGSLAEQIANNNAQINVLSGNQNGLKFYTSLTQINSSFTISTSITDIYLSMKDNSIAMFLIGGTNTVYPAQFGQCIIYKSTTNRDSIEFTDATTGKKYIGTCHVNYTGGFSGWDQIVTASMLSTIDARLTDLETQLISTQNI